jgi:hypothetical protein
MKGFVLVAAGVIDGELHQVVETTASVVGCSACGIRAKSRGCREVSDMASADRPVVMASAGRDRNGVDAPDLRRHPVALCPQPGRIGPEEDGDGRLLPCKLPWTGPGGW